MSVKFPQFSIVFSSFCALDSANRRDFMDLLVARRFLKLKNFCLQTGTFFFKDSCCNKAEIMHRLIGNFESLAVRSFYFQNSTNSTKIQKSINIIKQMADYFSNLIVKKILKHYRQKSLYNTILIAAQVPFFAINIVFNFPIKS